VCASNLMSEIVTPSTVHSSTSGSAHSLEMMRLLSPRPVIPKLRRIEVQMIASGQVSWFKLDKKLALSN
jgi:hypothetical protein